MSRGRLGVAVVLLVLLGALGFWRTSAPDDVVVEAEGAAAPVPRRAPVVAPVVSPVPDDPGSAALAALDRLAEVEGGLRLRCPDPGFPVGKSPFVRSVPVPGALEVLVTEPSGRGLVHRGLGPGRVDPSAELHARWGEGRCELEPVSFGTVVGVVEDVDGPRGTTWVTGCGAAMEPTDEGGRFALRAPVGEPCRLQAEGRGDGAWVEPAADREVDVVVPWVERVGSEREEVVARFQAELEDLGELDAHALDEALDTPDLDPEVRGVLERWRDEDTLLHEGRRRWLEEAIRRYRRAPPVFDEMDAPDVWNLDGATR